MHEFTLTLDELAGWAAGELGPVDAALADLGFSEDRRHAVVPLLAETVAVPQRTGMLEIRQEAGDVHVLLTLGSVVVAVLDRGSGPNLRSVVIGSVGDLPRLVADLIDLGPRELDAIRGPVTLPSAVVDALAGHGLSAEELGTLQAELGHSVDPDAVAALVGSGNVRWTLTLDGEPGAAERPVADVIDARDGGLWALLRDPEPAALTAVPVSAGTLWLAMADAFSR